MKNFLERGLLRAEDAGADAGGDGGDADKKAADSGAFDAAKFLADQKKFQDGVNATLNRFDKALKAVKPKDEADKQDDKSSGGDDKSDKPDQKDKKVDPDTAALRRELNELKTAFGSTKKELEAERTGKLESQRKADISDAIGEIRFKNAASKAMFTKAVQGDIVRDEEGDLVAKVGNELIPFREYIRSQADALPHLLEASGDGGSGATGGSRTSGGKAVPTLEGIYPGMPREELARAMKHVAQIRST